MSAPIFQLVYISRAARQFDNPELDQLAHVAASSNKHSDVTGMLLYDGKNFIQALEGERTAVEAIMARIARDPRHDSIAYVDRRDVATRQFGGWSMDVRRVRDAPSARAFLTDLKRTLVTVDDHKLVAAFIGFAMLGRPELRARRV